MGFKGSKEIYAVEYAGFIRMNDSPYYEGKDCLDVEEVGEDVARANASLFEAAPELLKALQAVKRWYDSGESRDTFVINKTNKAIEKAL